MLCAFKDLRDIKDLKALSLGECGGVSVIAHNKTSDGRLCPRSFVTLRTICPGLTHPRFPTDRRRVCVGSRESFTYII